MSFNKEFKSESLFVCSDKYSYSDMSSQLEVLINHVY